MKLFLLKAFGSRLAFWRKKEEMNIWTPLKADIDDIDDQELSILQDTAEMYLRSGGIVTPDFWLSMGSAGRAAFCSASSMLRAEICAKTGYASQHYEQFLDIISEVDGGMMRKEYFLAMAATKVAEKRINGSKTNGEDKNLY